MQPLFTVSQIVAWEQRWFNRAGDANGAMAHQLQCMQQAAWQVASDLIRLQKPVLIVCGTGNNGGDGFWVAYYLQQAHQQGYFLPNHRQPVIVQYVAHSRAADYIETLQKKSANPENPTLSKQLDTAALIGLRAAYRLKVPFELFENQATLFSVVAHEPFIILDAIFGIGLNRAPTGLERDAILAINAIKSATKGPCSGCQVIALDVPSGLQADTGHVWQHCAVKADVTLCLLALKQGLLTGQAPLYTGQIKILPLLPPDTTLRPAGFWHTTIPELPKRSVTAHKGTHGHVCIVGGGPGMGGACLLAAEAAMRMGAGKVTVVTRAEHISALLTRQPNIMAYALTDDLTALSDWLIDKYQEFSSIAMGMGLGRDSWGRQVWQAFLPFLNDFAPKQANRPLPKIIIDADALYHLKQTKLLDTEPCKHWYHTPHSGEAAYLLDTNAVQIEENRFAALQQLATRYGGQWLLKGAGTLVLEDTRLSICGLGNAGMAAGGMGDVLSGMAAGLMGQFLNNTVDPAPHLIDAVVLHAAAADLAASRYGQRGLSPQQLVDCLPELIN